MTFFDNIKKHLNKKNIYFKATLSKKTLGILQPAEKRLIKNSVLKRQQDFATGRWCVKQLFKELNINSTAILSGTAGEPIWPKQICGSISHTTEAYCAAIAYKKSFISIGIDIEQRNRIISDDAIQHFMNPNEMKNNTNQEYAKIIFSAKESVFKLLYPIIRKKFYFQDVSIIPNLNKKTFDFILNKNLSKAFKTGYIGTGNIFFNNKWIFTICSLPNN